MKYMRVVAIVLLVFVGLTALMGSVPMILYPSGDSTLLSLSMLSGSPFHSFLIPGILLFTANGLLAFTIVWLVSRRAAHSGRWTALQGCVLLAWIVAQCCLLHTVVSLHYFYSGIASVLISCGLIMNREENRHQYDQRG